MLADSVVMTTDSFALSLLQATPEQYQERERLAGGELTEALHPAARRPGEQQQDRPGVPPLPGVLFHL
jgi:hypothetical protein